MSRKVFYSDTEREIQKHTDAIMNDIAAHNNKLLEEVTMEVWAEWIAGTPVDEGRARASIIATKENPSDYVPPEGQASYLPQTPQLSGTSVNGYNWVVSNIDYMRDLNNGSSRQAPRNFIERAIVKGINNTFGVY